MPGVLTRLAEDERIAEESARAYAESHAEETPAWHEESAEFSPISRPPDDGRDLYEGASLHRQERAEYDAGWPGPYNPIIHMVRW